MQKVYTYHQASNDRFGWVVISEDREGNIKVIAATLTELDAARVANTFKEADIINNFLELLKEKLK